MPKLVSGYVNISDDIGGIIQIDPKLDIIKYKFSNLPPACKFQILIDGNIIGYFAGDKSVRDYINWGEYLCGDTLHIRNVCGCKHTTICAKYKLWYNK
jgi:hypothetical protein